MCSAIISNNASTVARTTASCLKSAQARLLLQGPTDLGIGSCLTLAGHLFETTFGTLLFHSQLQFWDEHGSQNEPNIGLLEPIFQKIYETGKVRLDRAGGTGLHMSPSLEALRATPTSKKKGHVSGPLFV